MSILHRVRTCSNCDRFCRTISNVIIECSAHGKISGGLQVNLDPSTVSCTVHHFAEEVIASDELVRPDIVEHQPYVEPPPGEVEVMIDADKWTYLTIDHVLYKRRVGSRKVVLASKGEVVIIFDMIDIKNRLEQLNKQVDVINTMVTNLENENAILRDQARG